MIVFLYAIRIMQFLKGCLKFDGTLGLYKGTDPFTPFVVTIDNKGIPAEDRAKLILGM